MTGKETDNRSEILVRALDLFAARGYDGIGVQEICVAAGVTKPTLYHYFGSKRGVLEALVHERSAPLLSALRQAAAYHHDLPNSLQQIAAAYFAFARREPVFYRFLLALWLATPATEAFSIVATLNAEQQQLVETLFTQAVPDHGNMRGRQRAYAATFLGTLNTYIALWLNEYSELTDAIAAQAVKQFSHGIYS